MNSLPHSRRELPYATRNYDFRPEREVIIPHLHIWNHQICRCGWYEYKLKYTLTLQQDWRHVKD